MSDLLEDFELVAEQAREQGLNVEVADKMRLFIDLDSEEALAAFQKKKVGLFEYPLFEGGTSQASKTPGHYHAVVFLNRELNVPSRLFLQLLLGSDETKERITFERWLSGIAEPIRLFTTKPLPAHPYECGLPFNFTPVYSL